METSPRARLYFAAAFGAFIGAAGSAYYGVTLVDEGMAGHGSRAGSILVGGLGIILVLAAPVLVIFGAILWNWSRSVRIN